MKLSDEEVRAAMAGELRLLDPAVRASPEAVTELLDPEFTEFGASGRRYDRASILAVTSAVEEDDPGPDVSDLSGSLLAPDLVHLTYVTERNGALFRRSSLWRRSGEQWRMYFHQGTPAGPAGAARAYPADSPGGAA
ncbi:nuclear transport factor 2 family protein [Streptomyces sp. NPDC001665]